MPIALVAIGVASLGLSVYQTAEAKKKQKKMEDEAKNYKRQDVTNPYENLQVSTAGSDLQQQNINTQVSTALDSLRSGGSRSILAGAPTLYDNIIKSNQQISASLDQQYNSNQRLEAEGNAMAQNMIENRETNDLIGIGNAINTYRQEYTQGLNNTAQSLGTAVTAINYANSLKTPDPNATSRFKGLDFQPKNQLAIPQQTGIFSQQQGNAIQSNLYGDKTYQDLLRQYNTTLYRR